MKKQFTTKNIVLAGIFIALGLILPMLTGHVEGLSRMISPMHFPILIAGFVCGSPLAFAAGFLTPLVSSFATGMPPLFPHALSMAFELAAYGCIAGLLYNKLSKKAVNVYISLIIAMVCGRLVGGVANAILLGISGAGYSFEIFMTSMFINAIPAIVAQIIIVPIIVLALKKAKIIK